MFFRKSKGIAYEERVAYELEKQGFKHVSLTPKTGDFGADILCCDLNGNKCAVQCKYYDKPVGYRAIEEALAGANYYACKRAIVITNKGYTKNAKQGASKLGVELYVFQFEMRGRIVHV